MTAAQKKAYRMKRAKARIKANKERKYYQRKTVDTRYCDSCGGQETWCEGCQMYSKYCCEAYGTCLCS